ncbi:MAG: ExbD/TolR family protein [Vulcanimicrobiota bacterium]
MTELFPERRKRLAPRIEIIPMVDVMFLLLVFYILSTIALTTQAGIPVQLPEAANTAQNPVEEVVVTIDKEGQFFVNKDKVKPEELAGAVEQLASTREGGLEHLKEGNIVLNADLSVQHRLVIQAMDQLRSLGITNFAIATEAQP